VVGLIYLGCVLVLTLLIGIAGRQHHAALADRQIFRFPNVLIIALGIGVAVPGFLGISTYMSFPHPGVLEGSVLAALSGAMTLVVLIGFLRTKRFRADVGAQDIVILDGTRPRVVSFRDVRAVVVVWPWRGRGRLELLDDNERLLCRIDGGVQDFGELVDLVESRCPATTRVREKDRSGKWSERGK
jgi:hypothetical protein